MSGFSESNLVNIFPIQPNLFELDFSFYLGWIRLLGGIMNKIITF